MCEGGGGGVRGGGKVVGVAELQQLNAQKTATTPKRVKMKSLREMFARRSITGKEVAEAQRGPLAETIMGRHWRVGPTRAVQICLDQTVTSPSPRGQRL